MRPARWLLVLVVCCGGPFQEAKKAGTSEALRDFASEHHRDPKALRALELADTLDWKQALSADTEQSYLTYLRVSAGGV